MNTAMPKFGEFVSKLKSTWSSDKMFISRAGGLRFKSQAGQIGLSVPNGSPPLRHIFDRSCVAQAQ